MDADRIDVAITEDQARRFVAAIPAVVDGRYERLKLGDVDLGLWALSGIRSEVRKSGSGVAFIATLVRHETYT